MPADRSLLSSTAQGSKLSSPMRLPLRRKGSSVSAAPLASSSTVGSAISGSRLPMRTSSPVRRRIDTSLATFCR